MATATSGQMAQTQHEPASRVSNQFIAACLARARQEDENEAAKVALVSSQEATQERNRVVACEATTKHAENHQRLATLNQSSNERMQQTKLSTNWPHHQTDGRSSAKHETDSASSCASGADEGQFELSGEQNNGGRCSSSEQTNKPHVGPMGIFFKVWSLVKVTKSRHSRMKRQMGETNTGQQFRFLPGEQFGSSSLAGGAPPEFSGPHPVSATPRGSQQQQPIQRLVLHDSHFKRAGSQPLPSGHLERRVLNAGHLRVGHTTNGLQALNSNTTTGTTSSSSGMSSTTSSTLATNYTDALQTRADSRRLNETASVGSTEHQRQNGRSWSARIRPNSFYANQQQNSQVAGNSHGPRYLRNQRNTADKRQSVQLATSNGGQSPEEAAKRQVRAQSEARQLEGVRRKAIALAKSSSPAAIIGNTKSKMSLRRFRLRPRQDSVSDDGVEAYDDEEDEDEEEEEEGDNDEEDGDRRRGEVVAEAATRTGGLSGLEQEEDSDLNDIYSTPNDSIQSVPSGQMMLGNDSNGHATRVQQQRHAPTPKSSEIRTPPSNGSSRMTKSFSANYFTQLTSDAQGARSRRGASDEPKVAGSNNSAAILEQDESVGRKQSDRPTTTHASGSRFFISSSSSEDSNPAQSAAEAQSPKADCWSVPSKQQQQIPVQSALHYHGPAIARPSSLAVSSANSVQLVVQSPSVQTPATLNINCACLEPNCLAMSPMLVDNFQPNRVPPPTPSCRLIKSMIGSSHYKKSPSLFDMKSSFQQASQTRFSPSAHLVQRYSSKYPQHEPMSSFLPKLQLSGENCAKHSPRQPIGKFSVPNSVSLHDCKLASVKFRPLDGRLSSPVGNEAVGSDDDDEREGRLQALETKRRIGSEYKLAQMLLELGSNPGVKDESGYTALMHAVISENLPAFKCLVKHGVDLNDTNNENASALDLICSKPANETLLEMLKLMIDNRVDLDRVGGVDGSRLLDRLIGEHQAPNNDKSDYIDCLLHNGAKLGSSTWTAARGKHAIQLKLLRKLCQDGYHLYKKCSIEAAVFRFEYALRRIDELEQQLLADSDTCHRSKCPPLHQLDLGEQQAAMKTTQLVKYQTFLGLSRCERKRGFFKRALEFANMSILIDSSSYEGYYSKAHILKDIGEKEAAILTIDQTGRLVSKSIELIKGQLGELDTQEESLVFDGCFNMHEPNKLNWIESTRLELESNLNYLTEAKRHVTRLRSEIVNDEQS